MVENQQIFEREAQINQKQDTKFICFNLDEKIFFDRYKRKKSSVIATETAFEMASRKVHLSILFFHFLYPK